MQKLTMYEFDDTRIRRRKKNMRPRAPACCNLRKSYKSASASFIASHHLCQRSRLLLGALLGRALALGRASRALALGSRRGLGGSTARERAAVGLRHACLHLHLHLVLLGLGRHLRGLLLDGHVALGLRHLELVVLLLVRLLDREHLLRVLLLVLGSHHRQRALLLGLEHVELC